MDRENKALGPGMFSQEGFWGNDPRGVEDIVAEDAAALAALGLDPRKAALGLAELTARALAGLGAPVRLGSLRLVSEEGTGFTPCPFGHPGAYGKGRVTATSEEGRSLSWSPLSLHLLERHGFLGGRGSPFRLEPADLARVLLG